MAYRAIVEEIATRRRLIVFPHSRKTAVFQTVAAAHAALDRQGRKMGDGWRGLIYVAGIDGAAPVLHVAI